MLGYAREELLGRRIEEFVPEESLEREPLELDQLQQGDVVVGERELIRKDGTTLSTEISVRSLPTGGIQGIIRDTTERKESEEERERLERQLRQAQRVESLGQLAVGVAHDINNLLVPVMTLSELGLIEVPENSELNVKLRDIHSAGEQMRDLTRQLLAFGRKQELDMRILNLSTFVKEFEKMLRRLIQENVEIVTYLNPALDSVNADASQIQQILVNLAVNARDAMPQGGTLTIETDNVELDDDYVRQHVGVRPGHYVMLAVADDGCGMDPETLNLAFEPFFSTKQEDRGTGLGLATVYGIVKQHGGSVWAYSEPGLGTTFKIYLPSADAFADAVVDEPEVVARQHGSEVLLVVEDDADVRSLACQVLRGAGYNVFEAASPNEALRIAKEKTGAFDLLVTDVIMPQMNGKQLHEAICERWPNTKVLYMSGYTNGVITDQGILETDARLLQKPFTVRGLRSKVREALDM